MDPNKTLGQLNLQHNILKLAPKDVHDRKLILGDPKSGKEREFLIIPQKAINRLKDYIAEKAIESVEV
jgi:hypothetical protein